MSNKFQKERITFFKLQEEAGDSASVALVRVAPIAGWGDSLTIQ